MFRRFLARQALRHNRLTGLWVRLCRPDPVAWADYLRAWGGFRYIGAGVRIGRGANITDPYLVSIGDGTALATCTVLGHDGSIGVLNRAYGVKLDHVGAVKIGRYCFVGMHAILMPGVRIGDRCTIAAGAVVTKDVPDGAIVGGNPARVIGNNDERVQRLLEQTSAYPWAHLIAQRAGAFDADMEPALQALRIKHFYPTETP